MLAIDKFEALKELIAELSGRELSVFRKRFDEILAQRLDEWLEREVAAGRFDELARQALEDDKAGLTTPL
jgi:hypothetical protein